MAGISCSQHCHTPSIPEFNCFFFIGSKIISPGTFAVDCTSFVKMFKKLNSENRCFLSF